MATVDTQINMEKSPVSPSSPTTLEKIPEDVAVSPPAQLETKTGDVVKDIAEGLVGGTQIIVHDLAEIAVTISDSAAKTVVDGATAVVSAVAGSGSASASAFTKEESQLSAPSREMTALEKEVWDLVNSEWSGK